MLRLSLAAATRQPYDLICILCGGRVSKEVEGAMSTRGKDLATTMGITPTEYGILFGVDATLATSEKSCTDAEHLERDESLHSGVIQSLASAMRTTLVSQRTSTGWQNASLRCAAAVSTRFVSYDTALTALVGDLARSDARRVDEYQSGILDDEKESDTHLLPICLAINVLSRVCTV